jgi:hypothetical protein
LRALLVVDFGGERVDALAEPKFALATEGGGGGGDEGTGNGQEIGLEGLRAGGRNELALCAS